MNLAKAVRAEIRAVDLDAAIDPITLEKAFDVILNMRPNPPVANMTAAARKTCREPSAMQ